MGEGAVSKDPELETIALRLEADKDYKVLRRLQPRRVIQPDDGSARFLGILLDVETTGLNPDTEEIIEIALLPFTYAADGRIFEVGDGFDQMRDPGKPIPKIVTDLTGITDAMVAGQSIDPQDVADFVANAHLIVAHNARFDRPFVERFCPIFKEKYWACSMADIDWPAEGAEGTKLFYLLMLKGLFFEGHRALNDCEAAIELLARPLPRSGELAFHALLQTARKSSLRIWAQNAPFELKETLKARGYRWNSGDNGQPKAWYIDTTPEEREAEIAYLEAEIFRRSINLKVDKINAKVRYSDRI